MGPRSMPLEIDSRFPSARADGPQLDSVDVSDLVSQHHAWCALVAFPFVDDTVKTEGETGGEVPP